MSIYLNQQLHVYDSYSGYLNFWIYHVYYNDDVAILVFLN